MYSHMDFNHTEWVYLSPVLDKDSPAYGGKKSIQIESAKDFHCLNHGGTHIDAPKHFFDRATSIDQHPASFWIFENPLLLDCPKEPNSQITIEDVKGLLYAEVSCLLIRTGFEKHRQTPLYWEENPGLDPELGLWLRENYPSIRMIGVDVISASAWKNRELGREAHKAFLDPEGKGNPVLILEDMLLSSVKSNVRLHKMVVLPLRILGADGTPCTIVGNVQKLEKPGA